MQIKILEVGKVQKEKKYFILPIKYEDKGKEWDRKIYSFNGDAYKVLKDAKVGDFYDVEVKKDDNGYWQWVEVTKAERAESSTSAAAKTGTVRSTYETPEERARRQVLIVRQSSIDYAIKYFTAKGVPTFTPDDVLTLAKRFEQHVLSTSSSDFADDKPWENDGNDDETN